MAVCLVLAAWVPAMAVVAAICPGLVVALNMPFYRFLTRKRGPAFAAASVPLHFVYYGCCGISVVLALGYWHVMGRSRASRPALRGPKTLRRSRTGFEAGRTAR
jgi:hypothetical protein